MSIDLSQFHQAFFAESVEHLEEMERRLLELNVDDPDPEELNAIFRSAHSVKGSSATFGFAEIAETTHVLENLLDQLRKRERAINRGMIDLFLETKDILRRLVDACQGNGTVDPYQLNALRERLHRLAEETPGSHEDVAASSPCRSPGTTVAAYMIEFVPSGRVTEEGLKSLLDELATFGTLDVIRRPDAGEAAPGKWLLRLATDRAVADFSESLEFVAESGTSQIVDADSWCEDEAVADVQVACNENVESADDCGFGFFEPLPNSPENAAAEPVGAPVPEDGDDGYGFFEPFGGAEPRQADEGGTSELSVPLGEPAATATAASDGVVKTFAPEIAKNSDGRKPENQPRGATPVSSESSIRVSVEKVDQLINLVGELVITQAMLLQTAVQMQEGTSESLMQGLTQLERNTRDLQESVMSIRMLPISFVFSRFPRLVRDLSGKLGKQVELKLSGENTELDKGLIERIADPLTHLVRNSLDHGIETPEKREAAGKHAIGTITLKACHQGGNIVIEVGDDGAGIDRQKILAKARERGMAVSDQMSDQEVFALIFEAGFSTAELVTDVSGRGVGMDVVRRNIQAMGGRVEIESMLGIGTRMTVRLPLTLAILDGMSVAVGDQIYILPLSAVVESLQPKCGEVKTMANQGRVIQVRNEYLPLVVLHEVFGLQTDVTDFTQGILVILEADGTKAALFVDALVGQHQVVIKSLEANYRRVHGISGATIMGDGHVAMILDASAIAAMTRSNMNRTA